MSAPVGLDEAVVRTVAPAVLVALLARGADFFSTEDVVQEALLRAHQSWPASPPPDATGWLVTVAWRCHLDVVRAEGARRDREQREPAPGPAEAVDVTLRLCFLCAHPVLGPTSAVALTLRALGGLSAGQIAQTFLVPEATMAQRVSRAKRTVAGVRLDASGTWPTWRGCCP